MVLPENGQFFNLKYLFDSFSKNVVFTLSTVTEKKWDVFESIYLCVPRPIPRICRKSILYISLLLLYIEIQH
jgi:hypothetical protein